LNHSLFVGKSYHLLLRLEESRFKDEIIDIKGIGINIDSPTIKGDLDLLENALGNIHNKGFDYVEIPVYGVDAIFIFKGRVNCLQTRQIQISLRSLNRLPRLYRRGTHLNRLLSAPVYREFTLIPNLTDGEFSS